MAKGTPMNRCKDYGCFVAWFTGLSYVALWPITAHGIGGIGLGAAWKLPLTLHAVGFAAAIFVATRIAFMVFRRWRGPRKIAPLTPLAVARQRSQEVWKAPPAAQAAKSRAQFGLRRLPQ
jgi:hypothetical protein